MRDLVGFIGNLCWRICSCFPVISMKLGFFLSILSHLREANVTDIFGEVVQITVMEVYT